MEVRESKNSEDLLKIEKLGYWHEDLDEANKTIELINAIELGRIVARDISGSDPERMSASNVASYVKEHFDSSNIKVKKT